MTLPSMIPVPGTDVEAWVVKSRYAPGWWSYTLFDSNGGVVGSDAVRMPDQVTQEQVARIAFLLEVEYT